MSDAYTTTLHCLTLKQLSDVEGLVAILDQNPDDVKSALEQAVSDGNAMAARGKFMITPAGRSTLDDTYPQWFADERASAEIASAMDLFESGVNKQVLALTTAWQEVEVAGERQPNDHSDTAYDAKIIDKLGAVLDKTSTVLAPLITTQPSVDRFLSRISDALTRAEDGELDYVSSVRIDSFHTVWFQMHEHILRITGRERDE
ncbi:hypothetical protein CH293_02275 [Rhodococcus sp. 14-2470-1b]|uniref:hypothetical protein n=1 Tax=Rhodococcus sp. 14-2470-1b TaxID=2023149 RepID=UPI000B9C5A9E|nr:hypothetical protein [Rhodococcus sp. 14-2470-1b]OZF57570.1 hypothetical protein CH293_02275 [Rhodococcus sp. 14-2470-1b]